MNGTFAVLFMLGGLSDMAFNYCDEGCLARSPEQAHLSISAGEVQFQGSSIGSEAYFRYEFDHRNGPFQNAVGASITDSGDFWLGFGQLWTKRFANDRAYLQLHAIPGLYVQGNGPDLGFPIEFRSGIELGYETRQGWRVGLSYDHRSNADLKAYNPGMETIQLRVSIPLK